VAVSFWLSIVGCPLPDREARSIPTEASVKRPALAEPAAPLVAEVSPAPAPSVRPRINEPYFASGALKKFTGVLEAESREVFKQRATILAALPLQPGSHVADVGAGTGLFTFALARRVGSTGRVYAVDIVPAFLARIRARQARQKLNNVVPLLAGERSVGLPDQSIDLAFLCDVYHHIEYPAPYLTSLRGALRADGKLVVIDFQRIPGVTRPAVLEHVRADREQVIREIERAGFRLLEQKQGLLAENYFLVFAR